jgi:hypothetical protein
MDGIDDRIGRNPWTAGTEHGAADIHDLTGARMTRSSPLLEEAWRYWSSLRPGTGLPWRTDLEPRAMRFILGHSMIVDRVRPGTVRIRLGGRVMCDLMGMEVRGLPLRALFDLDTRSRAVTLVEEAFATPATLELELTSDGPEGRIDARMLVLPLLDAEGRVTKALTCMALHGPACETPRRFALTRHLIHPLTDRAMPARPARAAPLPREIEAPAARRTATPWLRVVK